jgi:hypothetical protein
MTWIASQIRGPFMPERNYSYPQFPDRGKLDAKFRAVARFVCGLSTICPELRCEQYLSNILELSTRKYRLHIIRVVNLDSMRRVM